MLYNDKSIRTLSKYIEVEPPIKSTLGYYYKTKGGHRLSRYLHLTFINGRISRINIHDMHDIINDIKYMYSTRHIYSHEAPITTRLRLHLSKYILNYEYKTCVCLADFCTNDNEDEIRKRRRAIKDKYRVKN